MRTGFRADDRRRPPPVSPPRPPIVADVLSPYLQPGPSANLLGHPLRFRTAPGLFSPDRIDDGTRLLLAHLPAGVPREVLDIGCGYGALGLPIAAAHRPARVVCVDRDALAAATCGWNARENGLENVEARASLGHRDVPPGQWDWVLCNIPARIGHWGINTLVEGAFGALSPSGEVRVVVINDLRATLAGLRDERGWKAEEVTVGARHAIWTIRPASPGEPRPVPEAAYGLDTVDVEAPGGPLTLARHQDASEDPGHLREGLPLLLGCLPRKPQGLVVTWRAGAGASAVTLAKRGARLLAADRDLLALDYVRRNARTAGTTLATEAGATLEAVFKQLAEKATLVVGEATAAFGATLGLREITEARRHLRAGGEILWLVGERQGRALLAADPSLVKLASRGRWVVLRGGARA